MVEETINEQSSPPHLSGIRSLAVELLGRILEIAVEDLVYEDRQMLLCRASLVCKTWSWEAQLLLWKKIVLLHEIQARQLLSSLSLGKYTTEAVKLLPEDSDRLTGLSAGAVCANLVGIEHLDLAFFSGENILDGTFLGLPSLKGLISANLHDTYFRQESPPRPPLFTLQRLNIGSPQSHPFSSWFPLFQTSLKRLTIDRDCFYESEPLRNAFSSIGRHLQSLHIIDFPAHTRKWTSSLTRNGIYKTCTGVSHLMITFAALYLVTPFGADMSRTSAPLISLLGFFPEDTITFLAIYYHRTTARCISDVILDLLSCHILKQLDYLSVYCDFSVDDVLEIAGSEDTLKKWEGKGVKVKFQPLDHWETPLDHWQT